MRSGCATIAGVTWSKLAQRLVGWEGSRLALQHRRGEVVGGVVAPVSMRSNRGVGTAASVDGGAV